MKIKSKILYIPIGVGIVLAGILILYAMRNHTIANQNDHFVIQPQGTVFDQSTGLIWKKCAEGLSGSNCTQGEALSISWSDAEKYTKELNIKSVFKNHSEWRIPSAHEMATIVDFDFDEPAIDQRVFPKAPCCDHEQKGTTPWPGGGMPVVVVGPTNFWTSTYPERMCYPLYLEFNSGIIEAHNIKKSEACNDPKYRLRLVRGKPLRYQFQQHPSGTIVEHSSNLMWKLCPEGVSGSECRQNEPKKITWRQALEYSKNIYKGEGSSQFNDWRLPSVKEMITLIDFGGQDTNVNSIVPYVNTSYWTATTWAGYKGAKAWSARPEYYYHKMTKDYFSGSNDESKYVNSIRLVRSTK